MWMFIQRCVYICIHIYIIYIKILKNSVRFSLAAEEVTLENYTQFAKNSQKIFQASFSDSLFFVVQKLIYEGKKIKIIMLGVSRPFVEPG